MLAVQKCGSGRMKKYENYGQDLKRHFCKAYKEMFNDGIGTLFHYLRLNPRKWLILSLRKKARPAKMDETAGPNEIYITAGLKGENNSLRIKSLAEKLRRMGPRRCGRGALSEDKLSLYMAAFKAYGKV